MQDSVGNRKELLNFALFRMVAVCWKRLRTVTKLLFRIEVIGAHNIPSTGGALIVANHVSFADAFVLSCGTERPIRFLMLRLYFEIPFLTHLFRTLGAIPVRNHGPSKEALCAL